MKRAKQEAIEFTTSSPSCRLPSSFPTTEIGSTPNNRHTWHSLPHDRPRQCERPLPESAPGLSEFDRVKLGASVTRPPCHTARLWAGYSIGAPEAHRRLQRHFRGAVF